MHTVEECKKVAQVMRISGRVQGVGFRPFVHRLACDMGLRGSVRNQAGTVCIEIEGSEQQLSSFVKKLKSRAPKAAKIESIELNDLNGMRALNRSSSGFHIEVSDEQSSGAHTTGLPIDFALCSACQNDISKPGNRRFGYPFTSCSECGPRFSITQDLPFDRINTSMNAFPPCSECHKEYSDPNNRRFHAQTISCSRCGPRVQLLDGNGNPVAAKLPFHTLNQALANGDIVGIKSTGGFHLVCDAMNSVAVASLRALKHRPDKPFAVMASDISAVDKWLNMGEQDEDLVQDARAPIVLIPKNTKGIAELKHLAPSSNDLGVMRPYNGIYQCLFDAGLSPERDCSSKVKQKPKLLAVTSANPSGEPIISGIESFLDAFKGTTAFILDHDLSITNPCDDSVVQGGKYPMVFRLGRGYAPQVISNADKMNPSSVQTLALGAQEKSTLSVSNGSIIWISPELGKLNNINACRRFEAQRLRFLKMSNDEPMAIACDLHPDFHSSEIGQATSRTGNLPLVRVQHHQAHIAAVMQEHNCTDPVLGLSLDGFGLGDDQQAWGGELLVMKGANMRRLGHITQLKLAGGDAASRHPLRCAHSALRMLSSATAIARLQALKAEPVWDSLYDNPNSPLTSSMGRWFDAVAAMLGFDAKSTYEAQAAIYLEHLAAQSSLKPEPVGVIKVQAEQLNLLPLIELVLTEENTHLSAWRFHAELADGLCRWLFLARENTGINTVVASGGCIQNRILRELLVDNLKAKGFQVLLPANIPCNDAAISLGQIYIAQQTFAHMEESPCA